jgi:carboxypeptidase C (cathepsin A)
MFLHRFVVVALLAILPVCPAAAQDTARPTATGILGLMPADVTSRQSVRLGERTLDYSAVAGSIPLKDGSGSTSAAVFYVSYVAEPASPQRPVTFVFNGGPGAAAAYLHLGALGPRALVTNADGGFRPAPQRVADNPDTWLDMTDLVFVDPPGTGYSRAADASKEDEFWGVDRDAAALGAFIRLWLQKAGRTGSPVVLAGESYGGFRAALLAKTLQEDVGIAPSGVVMISPALEFSRIMPDEFDILTPALLLPSLAAVHLEFTGIRGPAALAERLRAVEDFALGDYLIALAQGFETGGAAIRNRIAAMTGLADDVVAKQKARIPAEVFAREYGRARGVRLSLYDGTLSAPDVSPASSDLRSPDPVLDRSVPVLTAATVDYLRGELGFRTELTYRLLNRDVSRRWDYGGGRQGYAGVLGDLQQARALAPRLRVLFVHGYTDLVTPYLVTDFLLRQLPDLPGAAPMRLAVTEGGHMMYLRPDARRALKDAARAVFSGPDW